ncbi:hypothetical protein BVRB_6g148330 [Beta vulgaris subsp. vulgaris]|nr:hypothetical protein BVRB_6g148330 [Beta vulgaris subsp. vulgaris]
MPIGALTGRSNSLEHLYLSNAEVQMNYGRIPTWQNSKVHFFAMSFMVPDRQKYSIDDDLGGEIEIEKLPHLEIEIKRKDLLSVFEHFHKVNSDWSNRYVNILAMYFSSGSYSILLHYYPPFLNYFC